MTTLEDDEDLTDASSPDASDEEDDPVDHDPNDTLVDVPDAEIVGDAVEMDGNDDVDLLTDGPYAPPEEIDADEPADLVVPPATTKPSRREHRAEMKASARRVRRVVFRPPDALAVPCFILAADQGRFARGIPHPNHGHGHAIEHRSDR